MKYLISGNKGQLGLEFQSKLELIDANVMGFDRDEIDIAEKDKLSDVVLGFRPDVIINCAAYNLVDESEKDEGPAYRTNVLGIKNLAELSGEINAFLVHFSTDYVFDGKKSEPYTEEDEPNPQTKYGRSKLLGEMALSEAYDNFLLLRTSWLYGKGTQNFVYKFLNWAKSSRELRIANNEVSTPTFTSDLVEFTRHSLKMGLKGTFHLVNSGYCSRYEWAEAIAEKFNLDNKLIKVPKEYFSLPAKRPDFSALSNSLITGVLDIEVPEWKDALRRFAERNR